MAIGSQRVGNDWSNLALALELDNGRRIDDLIQKQFIFPEDTCCSFGVTHILFETMDNVFTESSFSEHSSWEKL